MNSCFVSLLYIVMYIEKNNDALTHVSVFLYMNKVNKHRKPKKWGIGLDPSSKSLTVAMSLLELRVSDVCQDESFQNVDGYLYFRSRWVNNAIM